MYICVVILYCTVIDTDIDQANGSISQYIALKGTVSRDWFGFWWLVFVSSRSKLGTGLFLNFVGAPWFDNAKRVFLAVNAYMKKAPVGRSVAYSRHEREGVLWPGVQVQGADPGDVGAQVTVHTCNTIGVNIEQHRISNSLWTKFKNQLKRYWLVRETGCNNTKELTLLWGHPFKSAITWALDAYEDSKIYWGPGGIWGSTVGAPAQKIEGFNILLWMKLYCIVDH